MLARLSYVFRLMVMIGLPSLAEAQNELYDEPVVIYSHQVFGGVNMNSSGFGANFTYGKNKGAYRIRLFSLDLMFVKHEKETKSFFQDPNARSYFYGKVNNLYTVRPGIGTKHILTEKLRRNGVQVGYSWTIGPSLGFTKPIYLEILYRDPGFANSYYIEVEKFDPEKHENNIYGRASGLRGLGELRFHPGAFARFSWLFEYSGNKDGIKGIEVGGQVEVFPRRIEIMSDEILEQDYDGARNHRVFPSFFIHFVFGKKYNKS
ncbi:MAG: hypothetical protein ACK5XV_01710 [Flavobacteriales bacterium]|jgi:hypothetical protein